jgi:hypothetical protein
MESTIDKCIKDGRIRLDESGCIVILNWESYQRQDKAERGPMSDKSRKVIAMREMINDPEWARRVVSNLDGGETPQVDSDTGEIIQGRKV